MRHSIAAKIIAEKLALPFLQHPFGELTSGVMVGRLVFRETMPTSGCPLCGIIDGDICVVVKLDYGNEGNIIKDGADIKESVLFRILEVLSDNGINYETVGNLQVTDETDYSTMNNMLIVINYEIPYIRCT